MGGQAVMVMGVMGMVLIVALIAFNTSMMMTF